MPTLHACFTIMYIMLYIYTTSDVFKVSKYVNVKMKTMFININLIKLREKHPVFLPL